MFFAVNLVVTVGLYLLLGNVQQTTAAAVFVALVIGTLAFWRFRVAVAFIGIVILLVTNTIDLDHAVEFMNLDVILFLVGMMILVGVLRRSGFFRWLLAKSLEAAHFEPYRLIIIFLLTSAFMAALVDEVTSILFVMALVLDFCEFFKVRPAKLTIAVVMATNIGSSWTVLGNPIGILIALRSGLTFGDFLSVSFPIGLLALGSVMILVIVWMRRDLRAFREKIQAASTEERAGFIKDLEKIEDRPKFIASAVIFVSVIILLALHHRLELALSLEHNTLLVGTSIFGAGIVMLWQHSIARELLMKEVDWWTLVFFMFLFSKAGALQYVGLTDLIGQSLLNIAGDGNIVLLIILVLWITGLTSAAADNVVIVATFIPVLHYLTAALGDSSLWWALLFGGCYGGNMTMVGSTANIVALGILEDRAGHHMSLRYWLRIGLIGTLIPMIIATAALIVPYLLVGR